MAGPRERQGGQEGSADGRDPCPALLSLFTVQLWQQDRYREVQSKALP